MTKARFTWSGTDDAQEPAAQLLERVPEYARHVWVVRRSPDAKDGDFDPVKFNGSFAREIESWATRGTKISGERLWRAIRTTQMIWGEVHCETLGVTIRAIDGTWFELESGHDIDVTGLRSLKRHRADRSQDG